MILLKAGIVWGISLMWMIVEILRAPDGFEDEWGFHKANIREDDMRESPDSNRATLVRFFVTEECNGCGVCKAMAPDFFDFIEYGYSYFLKRQPVTEAEVLLLRDVADQCTLDAIRENPEYHG